MIEQIQPSWLPTRGQLLTYTVSSRLIVGLVFGLVIDVIAVCLNIPAYSFVVDGVIGGVLVSILDILRFECDSRRLREASDCGRAGHAPYYFRGLMNVLVTGTIGSLGCPFHAIPLHIFHDNLFGAIIHQSVFFVFFGLFFGLRASRRQLSSDIQTAETLHWSWTSVQTAARSGCLIGLGLALICGVMSCAWLLFAPEDDRALVLSMGVGGALIAGLMIFVTYMAFAGLQPRVSEMKTQPNQGIMLSFRSALAGGLAATVMIGVIVVPPIAVITVSTYPPLDPIENVRLWMGDAGRADLERLQQERTLKAWRVGLFRGVIVTSVLWPVTVLWYSGLDVLQHYLLRLILFFARCTPLNLIHFLDYAATDLNFLQKVGGGYIFIHRILLEHFAAMEVAGKSNPQAAPPRAVPILSDDVSSH